MLSRCWTAWIRSKAGWWSQWNNFRGSWGIWQLQWQSRRWGCFIWDRFSTGSMAEWAWQHGTHRVQVTPACCQSFTPWSDLAFLRAGVPLQQVSRHAVLHMDPSTTGWGAMYNVACHNSPATSSFGVRSIFLRDRAPCGTRVWTSGITMSCPWMGHGGSRWLTPRGSGHHHFGVSTVYETHLHLEVEHVCRVVLFLPRRPPEMPNQNRAFLSAARVGAKAVSLHP